jgi:tRNA-Thr(GGU) m(6)t(6)A37 methyltransferase TsaA
MTMEFIMHSIGTIHSPFTELTNMPIQSSRSKAIGQVCVDPQYAEGLEHLEEFSHIILLYVFHRSTSYVLKVKPFLDDVTHGLFATRYPCRPNQIGISIVRLLTLHDNNIEIGGVDVLDGTPLLDIKPYVPDFDICTDVRTGWYENRSKY